MGTRHLTVIIKDNEVKLSQYGQWDGYFSYTGAKFIEFVKQKLQGKNKKHGERLLEDFKEKVDVLGAIDDKTYSEYMELAEKYGTGSKNQSQYGIPLIIQFPQFSRDTGIDILNVVDKIYPYEFKKWEKEVQILRYKFPVKLEFDIMCIEFIHIINLDTEEIYMLTDHEFKGEHLKTCELVEQHYSLPCWYKSKIKDIPSIKKIEEYKRSIELDFYVDEDGTEHSN